MKDVRVEIYIDPVWDIRRLLNGYLSTGRLHPRRQPGRRFPDPVDAIREAAVDEQL